MHADSGAKPATVVTMPVRASLLQEDARVESERRRRLQQERERALAVARELKVDTAACKSVILMCRTDSIPLIRHLL